MRRTPVLVRAFAHCIQVRCPGYAQEEVDAVRTETEYTYADGGGDQQGVWANAVERSNIELSFSDDSEAPCPSCGGFREVTDSPRPSYQALSGHDPMGLLAAPRFDASRTVEQDERTAVLEGQLQEMREALAKLSAKED